MGSLTRSERKKSLVPGCSKEESFGRGFEEEEEEEEENGGWGYDGWVSCIDV